MKTASTCRPVCECDGNLRQIRFAQHWYRFDMMKSRFVVSRAIYACEQVFRNEKRPHKQRLVTPLSRSKSRSEINRERNRHSIISSSAHTNAIYDYFSVLNSITFLFYT